eukprot:2702550-Ditylum_brightwellii.AAC.1
MAGSSHDQTIFVQDVGEDNKHFWELLGGKGPIKEASEIKDDKMPNKEQTKVFKVSEKDGKIQITDPEHKKAVLIWKKLLKLILGAIFIWGEKSNKHEQSQAMIVAQNYIGH